jgi:hypothetical protein
MNRLAIIRDLRQYQWRIKMKYWKSLLTDLAKPVGAWAVSQPLIFRGEQP